MSNRTIRQMLVRCSGRGDKLRLCSGLEQEKSMSARAETPLNLTNSAAPQTVQLPVSTGAP
jgi:hypothetical protein